MVDQKPDVNRNISRTTKIEESPTTNDNFEEIKSYSIKDSIQTSTSSINLNQLDVKSENLRENIKKELSVSEELNDNETILYQHYSSYYELDKKSNENKLLKQNTDLQDDQKNSFFEENTDTWPSKLNKTLNPTIEEAVNDVKEENSSFKTQTNALEGVRAERSKARNVGNYDASNDNLKISTINIMAMSARRNGKYVETDNARNTNALRIDFKIDQNQITTPGEKDVYIVVLNPEQKVINQRGSFVTTEGHVTAYTEKTEIYYDNINLKISLFIDRIIQRFIKGTYVVKIFVENKLIEHTLFVLQS